ncbi:PQQ-binding-like beta-propeller repeat protein [Halopseudomonas pachastrellae]|nr:PQQ-binding-like beta-propeller repeat protein [Halopseudomonas pachastrellae]
MELRPGRRQGEGPFGLLRWVNRGVALWQGKVYVGTLDGRLIALDAKTGKPLWTQQTTDDSKPYTITGAPRVLKDLVLIGNGGAEFGVRGYFLPTTRRRGSCAGASTPYRRIRPMVRRTARLWDRAQNLSDQTRWDLGGGGTAWDSMAYDAELNLLYVGTGNGSPWNREVRSPGGGDNLYLSSILALRPETGELVWHYQTTPGDSWDYTATQQLTLAELEIDGKPRQVIMQAPKNGFFYVLDRATGELLSAEKFGKVTWAERIDMATGRPVEAANARYENEPALIWPSPFGAHNWHSMSYSPLTGWFTCRIRKSPRPTPTRGQLCRTQRLQYRSGLENRSLPREYATGALIAWDPEKQAPAWRVERPNHWNGGTLVTAGNLVFQGTSAGQLEAYTADQASCFGSSRPRPGSSPRP